MVIVKIGRALPRRNGSGLDLAQRIQRHGLPIRVVIATAFARAGFLRRALDAGVAGYVLKDAPAEQLAEAIGKLGVGNRIEAFRLARQKGWL